jgi:MFS family permease
VPRVEQFRRAFASRELGPLIGLSFVATFAFVGMESTFALLGDRRFGYDAVDMGLLFVVIGLAAAVSQGALVGRLVATHGERQVMLWGLAGTAAGLALMAAAQDLWLLLIALVLLGLASGLAFATLSALVSHAAPDDEQGGILGLAASTSGVARIVGPVTAGALFDYVTPGAPLALGAVLMGLCLAFALARIPRPAAA